MGNVLITETHTNGDKKVALNDLVH